MYLSVQEARGGKTLTGTRLSGLGFSWGDLATSVTNLIKNPAVTQLATQLIVKPKPAPAPVVQQPVLQPTSIAPGPGGAALPTAAAKPASIWSNKWTWVAMGGGVLLIGVGLAVAFSRKREPAT